MLLPNLSAGGSTSYNAKSRDVTTSFGFLFDPAEFTLGAQYNNEVKRSVVYRACNFCFCVYVVYIFCIMYLPCVYRMLDIL